MNKIEMVETCLSGCMKILGETQNDLPGRYALYASSSRNCARYASHASASTGSLSSVSIAIGNSCCHVRE